MQNYKHGGNLLTIATKYGLKPKNIIDFSTNTNPLGPPKEIKTILKKSLSLVTLYPEPDCQTLKKAIAPVLQIPQQQITFSNGAVELIYLAVQALQPHTVLIPGPTFREYEIACRVWKVRVKHLKLSPQRGFIPSLAHLKRGVQGTDLVFLCNPNNPTGRLIPPGILKPFLEFCFKQSIFVVIDESFLFFHPQWKQLTCIPETKKNKRILIIQSLTKFYAIPGLRVGYGVGHPETIAFLSSFQPPWQVNNLAQAVTSLTFRVKEYARQTRELIMRERDFLASYLWKIPCLEVLPSAANFLLVKLQPPLSASDVEDQLARRGILIRNCSNFAFLGDNFIRIAVKKRPENLLLLKNLEDIIKSKCKEGLTT
ncbi:MAG: threonine-phosphate decarboxylase CobD [Bacillota bacterium]|nr:threonine-phosphate decarboxylase CobD [Bacillota bacterium]